jgi:hypothetical protein
MNAASLPSLAVEVPAYIALQRQMHDPPLAQHPEWIERNGNCAKCDDYDRRFAVLFSLSLPFDRGHMH